MDRITYVGIGLGLSAGDHYQLTEMLSLVNAFECMSDADYYLVQKIAYAVNKWWLDQQPKPKLRIPRQLYETKENDDVG